MKIKHGNLLAILGLATVSLSTLHAEVLTWTGGSGTWNTTDTNWLNPALANVPWADGNDAVFGAGSDSAGTVTLSGAKAANSLTLNPTGTGSYVFGGDALTLGLNTGTNKALIVNQSATFNNAMNLAGGAQNYISFESPDQTLTFTGGGNILNLSGNNTGIHGTSPEIRRSSTLAVTAGVYNATGNAFWNIGNAAARSGGVQISGSSTEVFTGPLQIGNANDAFVRVSSNSLLSSNSQISIGRGSVGNVGVLNVDGGTLRANAGEANQAVMQIGRDNGTGIVEVTGGHFEVIGNGTGAGQVNGGVVILNSTARGDANASGTLSITGGVAVIKDLRFGGANNHHNNLSDRGTSTLTLGGTGSLYVGGEVRDNVSHDANGLSGDQAQNFTTQGGISNRGVGTSTYQVNFTGGGTLGSNADGTEVSVDIALTGASILKAADELNNARSLEISGVLSGTGGFTKTGGGTLTLSGANTYEGGTTITAGILIANEVGALGAGDVNLGNAILNLAISDVIADTATLFFSADSAIELGGTDTIFALVNTSNSQSLTSGTYTAAQLNTEFGVSLFSGAGSLTIVIPEPSSISLIGLGIAGLAFVRRRRVA